MGGGGKRGLGDDELSLAFLSRERGGGGEKEGEKVVKSK